MSARKAAHTHGSTHTRRQQWRRIRRTHAVLFGAAESSRAAPRSIAPISCSLARSALSPASCASDSRSSDERSDSSCESSDSVSGRPPPNPPPPPPPPPPVLPLLGAPPPAPASAEARRCACTKRSCCCICSHARTCARRRHGRGASGAGARAGEVNARRLVRAGTRGPPCAADPNSKGLRVHKPTSQDEARRPTHGAQRSASSSTREDTRRSTGSGAAERIQHTRGHKAQHWVRRSRARPAHLLHIRALDGGRARVEVPQLNGACAPREEAAR